jgi:GT2 family glycosyltransferase
MNMHDRATLPGSREDKAAYDRRRLGRRHQPRYDVLQPELPAARRGVSGLTDGTQPAAALQCRSDMLRPCVELKIMNDHTQKENETPPLVGIVILNWNDSDKTETCINSIKNIEYKNYFIVVLDNGSTKSGFSKIENKFPEITIMHSGKNLGFAGGMNILMRRAFDLGAQFVWMLNSDAVSKPETLSRLIDAALLTPHVGLASPLIGDSARPGFFQVAGGIIADDGCSFLATRSPEQGEQWQESFPDRIGVVGTAALYSREAFSQVGGFDEKLFAYNEDIDLSIRCCRAGFRNAYAFDINVVHETKTKDAGGQVAPHVSYYMSRNKIFLQQKYNGDVACIKACLWELSIRLNEIKKFDLYRNSPVVAQAMLAGIWDGFRLHGGEYSQQRSMPLIPRLTLRALGPLILKILQAI